MKRKHLLRLAVAAILFFSAISGAFAQGMAVNTSGTAADTSAMLDVASTSKGILVPRMTTAQRNAIVTPATGLMIFQTDGTAGFYYYSGSAWTAVAGSSGGGGAAMDLDVWLTATTTISTSTNVTLVYNNVGLTPTVGSYNNSTGAYTVGSTGLYMINAYLVSTTNANVSLTVMVNGAIVINGATTNSSGYGTYQGRSAVTTVLRLTAGDVVSIRAYNGQTVTTASITTDGTTRMMVVKM